MSEIGGTKPSTTITWAEGPGEHSVVEPATAEKQVGYYEGTGADDGEVLDADRLNWHLREIFRRLRWLEAAHPRAFEDLAEGIAATSKGDRLVVVPPDGKRRARYGIAWTILATSGSPTIPHKIICTDGQRAYYGNGTDATIYAANMGNSSVEWSVDNGSAGAHPTDGICADGSYVIIGHAATLPRLLDPSDGSLIATLTGHTDYGCYVPESNGVHLAYAVGTKIYIYDAITGARTYVGNLDHGADIYDIAIDDYRAYLVSKVAAAGGEDVRAVTLSSAASAWTYATEGSGLYSTATSCEAIITDGLRVYVGHARTALSAGGYGSIDCFRANTGEHLWTCDTGKDVDELAMAGGLLYSGGSSDRIGITDPATGDLIILLDPGVRMARHGSDGISLLALTTTLVTDDSPRRIWLGRGSVPYDRCDPTDPGRTPYHMLAHPTR